MTVFRLTFAVVIVLLIWLQSLFASTTHFVEGDRHVFAYGWTPFIFFGILVGVIVAFAEVARRAMKDWLLAVVCWLGIPLFGFALLPGYVLQRVEVSEDLLIYRREFPHTRFNADIAWDQVAAVTKIKRENAGLFAGGYYATGYEVSLRDGAVKELHSVEVVSAAEPQIDRVIAQRKIPLGTRTIPLPPN